MDIVDALVVVIMLIAMMLSVLRLLENLYPL